MIDLAKRASLPADTLKEINAKPTDEPGLFEAVYLCGNSMEYRHVTYSRQWEDEAYVLVDRTHYYPANRASSVVSQVRSLHAACPHYSPDTDVTMVVLPELKLPGRSKGIDDSYAYCEDIRTANHKFICTAYFARGHLLSVVWAMNATLEDAQAVLQVVAPLAERSLLRV